MCVGLALVGCGTAAPPSTGRTTLPNTNWRLDRLNDAPVPPSLVPITVHFDPKVLAGSAGCHSFSATYTTTGSKITIHSPQLTVQGCPDAALGVEREYLTALAAVRGYQLVPDRLILLDANGNRVLSYVPQK